MACSSVVLVVFLFCVFLSAYSMSFNEHQKILNESRCKTPQRRFLYIDELVSREDWENKFKAIAQNIIPTGTFVHRCQQSGCCLKYNDRCQAVEEEKIELPFANLDASNKGDVIFQIAVTNHTRCACQKKDKKGNNSIK